MEAPIRPGNHALLREDQLETRNTAAVRQTGPSTHLKLAGLDNDGLRQLLFNRIILVQLVDQPRFRTVLLSLVHQVGVVIKKQRERHQHDQQSQQRQVNF